MSRQEPQIKNITELRNILDNEDLLLGLFKSYSRFCKKNFSEGIIFRFLSLFSDSSDPLSPKDKNIYINYWQTQNIFIENINLAEPFTEAQINQLASSLNPLLVHKQPLSGNISYSFLSQVLQVRILVKRAENPGKLLQFERLESPITLYILELSNNDFCILNPIEKNTFWGYKSNNIEYEDKKIWINSEATENLRNTKGICCVCKREQEVIWCKKLHGLCNECIEKRGFSLKCSVCGEIDLTLAFLFTTNCTDQQYSFNFSYFSFVSQTNELKIINDSRQSPDKCLNCKIHSKLPNLDICYYCKLKNEIISKS